MQRQVLPTPPGRPRRGTEMGILPDDPYHYSNAHFAPPSPSLYSVDNGYGYEVTNHAGDAMYNMPSGSNVTLVTPNDDVPSADFMTKGPYPTGYATSSSAARLSPIPSQPISNGYHQNSKAPYYYNGDSELPMTPTTTAEGRMPWQSKHSIDMGPRPLPHSSTEVTLTTSNPGSTWEKEEAEEEGSRERKGKRKGKGKEKQNEKKGGKEKKTTRFWLIFASLMAVTCLTAVDMTIISTTLPTIVLDLPKSGIPGSWVTSAFLLTTTAFQPFMGGLSDVLGRRNALIVAVLFFLGGSVVSAMANTMLLLVIGRGVQGIGGGGVQAIAEIILSDLTTLRERGIYVGLISLVFAVSSFIAPVLGGVFSGWNWRWVFWINLPIGGVALAMIIPTMKLKTPKMPLKKKIQRMDIVANVVLLGSVVGILIGVTDGGIVHPWNSWRIMGPLIGGGAGLILFFLLEFFPNPLARDPVLPRRLFGNRTAGVCFVMTFLHGVVTYGLIYMLPVYFQSIKGATPLKSAIDMFPATAPGPIAAIVAGIVMAVTGKYKMQIAFWWAVLCGGCATIYLFDIDTPMWQWIVFQLIGGFGVGALFALTLPPIQASLPIEELAHATATFAFCRSFGSVWGIAMGTTIFVSTVDAKLRDIPGLAELGLTGPSSLGFATELGKLPPELQESARSAFASSLKWAFLSYVPVAGISFLISFFVKELPLPDFNESQHGLVESNKSQNTNASSVNDTADQFSTRLPSLGYSPPIHRPSTPYDEDFNKSQASHYDQDIPGDASWISAGCSGQTKKWNTEKKQASHQQSPSTGVRAPPSSTHLRRRSTHISMHQMNSFVTDDPHQVSPTGQDNSSHVPQRRYSRAWDPSFCGEGSHGVAVTVMDDGASTSESNFGMAY